jgi:hypothetical protein
MQKVIRDDEDVPLYGGFDAGGRASTEKNPKEPLQISSEKKKTKHTLDWVGRAVETTL